MKHVLGISGFAGSGKDTLADYLVADHGFEKISLASPMKKACKDIFGFTDEQLWGPSANRNRPDPRWPFSGTCPKCQTRCEFKGESGEWYCKPCDEMFPSHVSPRLALQTLGTEWGRTLSKDIWVRAVLRTIDESEHARWVIPDVRFVNEMDAITDAGGKLLRLLREEQNSTHPSEAEMAQVPDERFDFLVNNKSTKAALYATGSHIVDGWINGRSG